MRPGPSLLITHMEACLHLPASTWGAPVWRGVVEQWGAEEKGVSALESGEAPVGRAAPRVLHHSPSLEPAVGGAPL